VPFGIKLHAGQPSQGTLLHASPQEKAAGTNTLYLCSKLPGAVVWGRSSPNHPAISCFFFLGSFGPESRIRTVCLQPLENFWQGQQASGWAKGYAYLSSGENQANTTRPRLALGFFAKQKSPPPSGARSIHFASLLVTH